MKEHSVAQRFQGVLNALKNTKADPSHHVFQNLAAGPLEELLSRHGAELIEEIEVEARRSPEFNLLLGGVWKNSMSEEVWRRVCAARRQTW